MSKQLFKNIVVGGHQKVVEAGSVILKSGGNAFDALIAAFITSCVAESGSISLGGGGFLLAQPQGAKPMLLDFFTQTPILKKKDSEVDFRDIVVNYQDAEQIFHVGAGSVATPGNVAAIFEIHEKLCTMPVNELAQPAIELAKGSWQIDDFQSIAVDLLRSILLFDESYKPVFEKENGVKERGDSIHIPCLAEAIEAIVLEGKREFYEGEFAKKIDQDFKTLGGYLSLDDFKNYKAIWRNPLEIKYKDSFIYTNNAPSAGGLLMGISLNILQEQNENYQWGSKQYLESLAKCFKQTNFIREKWVDGKPLNESYFSNLLNMEVNQFFDKNEVSKLGSTTHISILDKFGNAASLTHSNGEGSGYVIPGTGIMLNNMLGEADLNPHGFHNWACNRRIASMMSPCIINDKNGLKAILGSGGANRIRTAMLQGIVNILDYNMPIDKAIENARIHVEGDSIELEGVFDEILVNQLNISGLTKNYWKQSKHMFFGGINGISRSENEFLGHADSRRFGACAEV